jgi:adenylate cyclase
MTAMSPSEPVLPAPARISRRDLRLASGLVLFTYVMTHLVNHALGLISLDAAETALRFAFAVWSSVPGTALLYGAAALHIALAFEAIYQRRTLRLPPLELLRNALGLWLPVLLIGHAMAARIEYELIGSPSTYSRIVTGLWASNAEWRQIGLLAPGWLHGCLGLRFAFGHRPWWQRLRLPLFAIALLVPVLSGLGFLAMGRELARTATPPTPANAETRAMLARTRDDLLVGYAALVALAFAARGVRYIVQRRRSRLVTVAYPDRAVRMPRGWSVLDASRAFHVAHASSCGGRARCSTCRVRVIAGAEHCPPPDADERATLAHIGADNDVRLACRLRPDGDIAVALLVKTEKPVYRARPTAVDNERAVVLLFCDFTNRAALAREHLAHDVLFAFSRYADSACAAISRTGGTISYVEHESICAVFGLSGGLQRAAKAALAASAGIERALAEINLRLGDEWGCRADITVAIHAGRAALSHIAQTGTIVAAGEALEIANEIRRLAAARGQAFAISGAVFTAAGVAPPATADVESCGSGAGRQDIYLSATAATSVDADWRSRLQRATAKIMDGITG